MPGAVRKKTGRPRTNSAKTDPPGGRTSGRARTARPVGRSAGTVPLRSAGRRGELDALVLPPSDVPEESYPGDLGKFDALIRSRGLRGLSESDASVHLPLEPSEFIALAQRLEELGRVRILSFRPLFVVSKAAIDFLGRKIVSAVDAFHRTHPKRNGIPVDRLTDRFDVPRAVLKLALKTLVHENVLRRDDDEFAAASFQKRLPVGEERALEKLEEMCFSGDFRAVSMQEIQDKYRIAPPRLEAMLAELIERRRVVRGQDGFYLHARWLDEIVAKIRALGKKEMTIAEFKALTGMSRKYAIPLLELLDQKGITRRQGSVREIL